MSSSNAAAQMRVHHEALCARIFHALARVLKCPFVLVTFDLGEPHELSSVEFKSALPLPATVEAFEKLLDRWQTGAQLAVTKELAERLRLPSEAGLLTAKSIIESMSPGRGFALLCGYGELTQYIATGAREDVKKLLTTELLPHWREEAKGAARG